ncbi:MAG: YdcH family protein [Magnetovibrio sp.]|nr:YdcH family protein [Magnetovibrio sp.]
MNDILDDLPVRLEELKSEHRDLDDIILRISEDPAPDLLQLQRLKKRKLMIKDQIAKLESGSIPDIIA